MPSTQIPITPAHACARARNGRAVPVLALALAVTAVAAAPAPPPATGPNTGVLLPTSRGAVRGLVLDGQTQKPIADARVQVEEEGAFARQGPTTARTDATGRFTARAQIGRSWRKIDWMRVFTSFPPLLLLRPHSIEKQSNTLLATRVNLRVEKDGYRPFVGEVRCERLDADKLAVDLDDVWLAGCPLAGAGAALVSFSPSGVRHEQIEAFTVEPAVARPGDRVTITARVRVPFERGGRYRVYLDSSEPQLVVTEQRLEAAGKPDPQTGLSTFRRVVRLPRSPKVWSTELSPWISRDYREVPLEPEHRVLLQVVRNDAEAAAARPVGEAYDRLANGEPGAAAEMLQKLTVGKTDYSPAYRYLGEACEESGRTEEAAAAYERLVALAPKDVDVAWPRYAESLLEEGRLEDAGKALDQAEKQAKTMPAPVALARARLLARRGDLRAADEQLARAGKRARIPRAVQREIALRRAEAALKAAPDSPDAELAMARALADLDRLEEATLHARRAQTLRPDEPWPLVELAALERRRGRNEIARAALERALALDPGNADAHLALGELQLAAGQAAAAREHLREAVRRLPSDFAPHHALGLAELRAGDRDVALRELRVAAVIGRGKGELNPGLEVPFGLFTTLYFGPKRQRIEGFARREAADDYQLARALERLKLHPEDALAHLNAGTALARLEQWEPALASLDRAGSLSPDLADLPYWRAVALIGLKREDEARRALEETLRQSPAHPQAHRLLARLCLQSGEMEQAREHLAAERRQWPDGVELEPALAESSP
jgi:tetratricopeptide (TPR) repeat protein